MIPDPARLLCLLVGFAVLGGCAAPTKPHQPPPARPAQGSSEPSTPSNEPAWWFVRFRFERHAAGDARFFLDPLVADQVVAPVLAAHRRRLVLWRFHRRAGDDAAGHQLSFLFYADADAARDLMAEIAATPLLEQLRRNAVLTEVVYDTAVTERRRDPGATSDPGWPEAIQREWPSFIMGASEMWLGLVRHEAARHADAELLERYRAVEEALAELWFDQAQHAFFHHLNALFGYQPVRVRRTEVMRF